MDLSELAQAVMFLTAVWELPGSSLSNLECSSPFQNGSFKKR